MTGPEDTQAASPTPKPNSRNRRPTTPANARRRVVKRPANAAKASAAAKPATTASTTKGKPAPSKAAPARPKATPAKPAAKAKPKATPAKPEAKAVPTKAAVEAPPVATEAPTGVALYFVRHADAGDPATWIGDDADRPLSKKGRRQARRLARLLGDLDVRADAVLTSSKLRAADTAKVIGRGVGVKAMTDERLTLDFGRDELSALVAGLAAEVRSAVIVGHDPDFSAALSWLVGAPISMRKGALALVDLPDRDVAAGRGSLRWLLPPDAIAG